MANRAALAVYSGQKQPILNIDRLVDASGKPVAESVIGGAIYFVDPTSDRFDDTNDYTPYQTIQAAVTAAVAAGSGTILIAPGNYSSENITIASGSIKLVGLGSFSGLSGEVGSYSNGVNAPVRVGSIVIGSAGVSVATVYLSGIYITKSSGNCVLLSAPGLLAANYAFVDNCHFLNSGSASSDHAVNVDPTLSGLSFPNYISLTNCRLSTNVSTNRAIIAGGNVAINNCSITGGVDNTGGSGSLSIYNSRVAGHAILGVTGAIISGTIFSPAVTASAGLQFANSTGTVTCDVSNCVINCITTSGEWVSKAAGNATLRSYNNAFTGSANRVPTTVTLVHPLFSPVRLQSVIGIDGKTVATTNLYTVPTGFAAVVTGAQVRLTTATSLTVVGAAGIGVAAGEDDIFSSQNLIAVLAAGDMWNFPAIGKMSRVAAGSTIKLGIDVAYTGTAATLRCDLFGYLETA